jgi:cell volume regulation protein A
MLIELLVGDFQTPWDSVIFFIQQFGLGIAVGLAGGWLTAKMLSKVELAPALYSLLALAMGFSTFGLASVIGGSGFLAIYLCGLLIGNQPGRHLQHILPVHDGLAWLSQIGLFLVLGLLVTPHELLQYALPSLVIALALIFIARPLAVLLTITPFFKFRKRELGFISWVGLRGAVPIVLAIFPVIGGVENATLYFNVAFAVVLLSLLIQGGTLSPMARLMQIQVPAGVSPRQRGALGILPEQDYEIFVYTVENPNLDDQPIQLLQFPSGALISGLFRGRVMLHPKGNTRLKIGDVLCVISREEDLEQLNQIFSGETKLAKAQQAFFGAFVLNGDAPLVEVAKAYGLTVSGRQQHLTLGEFIARRVGGHPVVGDDVDWHGIHWVVKEVEGDSIIKVGMRLY